jgi:hypothetical protein
MSEPSEKKAETKISLEQFIKEHSEMFTVIGVFGALTAFFARLENASYLAFFSFLIFILLDVDLWIRFPKSEKAGWTLKIFEGFLQLYIALVGYYLIQVYPNYVAPAMLAVFMVAFLAFFLFTINKYRLYEPLRRRSTVIRIVISSAIYLILIILSLELSLLITALIKNYLHYPS